MSACCPPPRCLHRPLPSCVPNTGLSLRPLLWSGLRSTELHGRSDADVGVTRETQTWETMHLFSDQPCIGSTPLVAEIRVPAAAECPDTRLHLATRISYPVAAAAAEGEILPAPDSSDSNADNSQDAGTARMCAQPEQPEG